MRIAVVGGGPAGLYFAILMKKSAPQTAITVYERNRPDDTFGWGVVFSDQTVENLMANDPVSGAVIRDEFAHWDDIDVHIHGETIRSSGHGFIGIGRKRLLNILQERARELGVVLHFEHEGSADLDAWEQQSLEFLPAWMVFDFRLMYAYFQESGLKATSDDIKRQTELIGHEPRSFEDFARETAKTWQE